MVCSFPLTAVHYLCFSLVLENMIYKGLNEEDASFLSDISKKKAELHNRRFDDESEELLKFRISFQYPFIST